MPAIAAVLSALTGIICRGGEGWYGEDLVYFVTEVLFTGAAAYGYRIIFTQWPEALDGPRNLTPRQSIGLMMLAGTVLMALARVEILGTFSMGRLLAAVGVMLAARKGVGEGVLAGPVPGWPWTWPLESSPITVWFLPWRAWPAGCAREPERSWPRWSTC